MADQQPEALSPFDQLRFPQAAEMQRLHVEIATLRAQVERLQAGGGVVVPVEFVRGFSALAHNYSLKAEAPFYYRGTEADAFSNAYKRCGEDLAKLRAMLNDTLQPTPVAAEYAPLLVRDIAEMLGTDVPCVAKAFADLGFLPLRSTNMEVTPDEAVAVAKHLTAGLDSTRYQTIRKLAQANSKKGGLRISENSLKFAASFQFWCTPEELDKYLDELK